VPLQGREFVAEAAQRNAGVASVLFTPAENAELIKARSEATKREHDTKARQDQMLHELTVLGLRQQFEEKMQRGKAKHSAARAAMGSEEYAHDSYVGVYLETMFEEDSD